MAVAVPAGARTVAGAEGKGVVVERDVERDVGVVLGWRPRRVRRPRRARRGSGRRRRREGGVEILALERQGDGRTVDAVDAVDAVTSLEPGCGELGEGCIWDAWSRYAGAWRLHAPQPVGDERGPVAKFETRF